LRDIIPQIKTLLETARNHQGFRKYGENTFWLFVEKALRMILGFAVGIYVARQLGPGQYGMLNYAINFVSIFGVLVGFGMDFILVRELVNKTHPEAVILGTAGGLRLAAYGIMLLGLGSGLLVSGDDHSTQLLIIIIGAGYFFQIFQGLEAYFQSGVLVRYVVWSQLGALLVVAAGRFYFAWNHAALYAFAAMESLLLLLTFSGMWFFYVRTGHRLCRWRFERNYAFKLIKDSWILLLSGMLVILCMRVDQIIIKRMLGAEAVGNYAVMNRLVELWYFIPTVICTSLFPSIIGVREFSREKYERRLLLLYTLMLWGGIGVFLLNMLFGKWLIKLLYGAKYEVAGDLIGWYSLVAIFVFFGMVRGKWLIAEGIQKFSLADSSAGLVLIMVLNIWLIPYYGLKGSVIAAVSMTVCVSVLSPLAFRRSRESSRFFLRALNPFVVFKGGRSD